MNRSNETQLYRRLDRPSALRIQIIYFEFVIIFALNLIRSSLSLSQENDDGE